MCKGLVNLELTVWIGSPRLQGSLPAVTSLDGHLTSVNGVWFSAKL